MDRKMVYWTIWGAWKKKNESADVIWHGFDTICVCHQDHGQQPMKMHTEVMLSYKYLYTIKYLIMYCKKLHVSNRYICGSHLWFNWITFLLFFSLKLHQTQHSFPILLTCLYEPGLPRDTFVLGKARPKTLKMEGGILVKLTRPVVI